MTDDIESRIGEAAKRAHRLNHRIKLELWGPEEAIPLIAATLASNAAKQCAPDEWGAMVGFVTFSHVHREMDAILHGGDDDGK